MNASSKVSPSVSFFFINPLDPTHILNTSICDDVPIEISIPVSPSTLNTTLIKDFSQYGINLTNPNDPIFNEICIDYSKVIKNAFSNSSTLYNLKLRKQYLLQKDLPSCSNGNPKANCYNKPSTYPNYTTCVCKGMSEMTTQIVFEEQFVGTILDSNYGVLKCYQRISEIFTSYGFFFSFGITFLLITNAVYSFKTRKEFIQGNFQSIRKYEKYPKSKPEKEEVDKKDPKKSENNDKNLQLYGKKRQLSELATDLNKLKKPEIPLMGNFTKLNDKSSLQLSQISQLGCTRNSPGDNVKLKSEEKHEMQYPSMEIQNYRPDPEDLSIIEIEMLTIKAQRLYDPRGLTQYFIDSLILDNLLFRTFCLNSLQNSKFIRLFIFSNTIHINLFTICLLFDLSSLDSKNLQLPPDSFTRGLSIAIWSAIITGFINFLLEVFIKTPEDIKNTLNESILTKNVQKIQDSYSEFLSKMKIRYFIFVFLSVSIAVFNIYYFSIFIVIYSTAIINILAKLGMSLMINLVLIGFSIPSIMVIFRFLSLKYEALKFLMNFKIIEEVISR